MIGICPFVILRRASFISNQPALSASENSCIRPDLGGHSIENVLLSNLFVSKSPSKAHADIVFPLGCVKVPNSKNSPSAMNPVSSWNSRRAAVSGSSSFSYIPLGMDQLPSSFLPQKDPPGWISNISRERLANLNTMIPALRLSVLFRIRIR